MRGAFVLAIAVGGLASFGCGDDGLRTLSAEDVSGIPPGNATGTLFSGRYTLTRAWKVACRCRVGSCATLTIDPALGTTTVMQSDGALTMSSDNQAVPCTGGIDNDGRFVCGQSDGSPPIATFSITTGAIALANGQPASMRGLSETTTVLPGFECDVQIGFDATFVGP